MSRQQYSANLPIIDAGQYATFPRPLHYSDDISSAPHYLAEEGMGCCIPSENPNMPKWTEHAVMGVCGNLSMKKSQCCGLSGERCVHGRNQTYDAINGYNMWFPKQ